MSNSVDWYRVIWDLVQRDLSLREISERLDIARSTLQGYLEGSHPAHWKGELLVRLWSTVTGRDATEVPQAAVPPVTRHEIVRSTVLKADAVASSLAQLSFAWYADPQTPPPPAVFPDTPATPVRMRFGLAKSPWADRPVSGFVVYDDAEARRIAGCPGFVGWLSEWLEWAPGRDSDERTAGQSDRMASHEVA